MTAHTCDAVDASLERFNFAMKILSDSKERANKQGAQGNRWERICRSLGINMSRVALEGV
jgi:hypothetical protein